MPKRSCVPSSLSNRALPMDPFASPRPEGLLPRARRALADSAWTPLAAKAALYLGGAALLALVGSGELRCISARPEVELGVAHAATAAPSSAAAPSSSTPPEAASAEAPAPQPPVAEASDAGAAPDSAAPPSGVTPDGKVILNLATEDDLRRLPGVGPSRARAILALRARLKRFKRVEDLLRVKGIGRRSLARLRPLVVLDG